MRSLLSNPDTQQSNAERPCVLISGGATRIGLATAEAFFARGCNLILLYHHSATQAKRCQTEFNAIRPGSCISLQQDLRADNACETLLTQSLSQFGRLDHLVNNAAIFYPTPLFDSKSPATNDFMRINALMPARLARLALPHLAKNKGSVTNLIDIYANAGLAGHSYYVASKAALKAITHQQAREFSPSVRVNGVSPGAILWPEDERPTGEAENAARSLIIEQSALKRLGKPANIAATVVYLALDASYTQGSVINVDGGRRLYI